MRAAALGVVFLTLVGCGGGGDGPVPPEREPLSCQDLDGTCVPFGGLRSHPLVCECGTCVDPRATTSCDGIEEPEWECCFEHRDVIIDPATNIAGRCVRCARTGAGMPLWFYEERHAADPERFPPAES